MTDRPACTRYPHLDWTIEPTENVDKATVDQTRQACANICGVCPVRNQCGAQAEADRLTPGETIRPFGIHAGLLYDGTSRPPTTVLPAAPPPPTARAPRIPRPPQPISHGTPGGERTHQRRGERPCAACAEARRAYDAQRSWKWRQARKQRAA